MNLIVENKPIILEVSGDMGNVSLVVSKADDVKLTVSNSGTQGIQGVPGEGVAPGGNTDDVLVKKSGDSFDTQWKSLEEIGKAFTPVVGSGLELQGADNIALKAGATIGIQSTHYLPLKTDQSHWNESYDNISKQAILFAQRNSTGLISGGTITLEGGIRFTVAEGIGQVVNHSLLLTREISWDEQTGVETVGDGVNYFCIDTDGLVRVFLTDPDRENYIYIGACVATQGNTVIIDVQNNPEWIDNYQARVTSFAGTAIKTIVEEGCEVSEPSDLSIVVADGVLNTRLNRVNFSSVGDLKKVFGTSNYGFVMDLTNSYSPANKINTSHWNDFSKPYGQSMIEMTDGYWKKDLIAIFSNGSVFYVYSQSEYLTEALAKQAPIQYIPGSISTAAVYLAFIISRKGDTSVSNRIFDIRPHFPRIWGQLGNDADLHPANQSVNMMSTGLLEGGELSINADPTKFNILGGNAIIVDNTDVLNPSYIPLNWQNQNGITDPLIATCDTTYLRLNSAGQMIFSADLITEEQRRDFVEIGWLDHPDRATITFAYTEPFYNSGLQSQFNDFVENFGPFNITGNDYGPSTGLQIKRSEGHIFDGNSNFVVSSKDPHTIHTDAEDPCEIYYYYRADLLGNWVNDSAPVSVIDPDHYDIGTGTLADVPVGKWTIQIISFYPIYGSNDIQYGQTVYDTYDKALGGLYDLIDLDPYNEADVFRCWLIVKQGTTDLTNISFAKFIRAGRVRLNDIVGGTGGGGSGAEEIVSVNSEVEETAAFDAGAKIVIRLDLL